MSGPQNGRVSEARSVPHSDAHGATVRGGGGGRFVRRQAAEAAASVAGSVAACDRSFADRYPALHEWLTLTRDDVGQRMTATLLLFAEAGRFKACFCDRQADASFFRSSESVEGLWSALESALADGSADWRARRQAAKR